MNQQPIHIGTFCGIGGFHLAAQSVGFVNAASCEIGEVGNDVLSHYWPEMYHHRDVRTLTGKILDNEITKRHGANWRDGRPVIMSSGFPCQPVSIAGRRKGEEDNRFLWPEAFRIMCELRPDAVVFENVLGLLSILEPGSYSEMDMQEAVLFSEDPNAETTAGVERIHRRIIARIIGDIEQTGYILPRRSDGTPIVFCVPACAVGAPHARDRVWLVAYANDGGQAAGPNSNRSTGKRPQTEKTPGQKRDWSAVLRHGSFSLSSVGAGRGLSYWTDEPPLHGNENGVPRGLDRLSFNQYSEILQTGYGNAICWPVAAEIFTAIKESFQ